ncbi:MAG: hypothetical protein AAFX53_19190 [Bacteroidota bacterium]
MSKPKKLITLILIGSFLIWILIVGLFLFVVKKNGITEFDRKKTDYQPTTVKVEKVAPEFERGKKLFTSDCSACHHRNSMINTWRMKTEMMDKMGIEYFKKYITNQDSLTNTNDFYARKLKEKYGSLANSHNFDYSQSELIELIGYIEAEI